MKKQKTVRNGYPLYLIAAVWVVMCFIAGVHTWTGYLLTILLSVAAYWVGKRIWPDEVVEYVEPEPEPSDPEVAALKRQRDESLAEIRRLNDAIPDAVISRKISHIETVSNQIYTFVMEKPEKKTQIRRFQNYYLPTTIKLLDSYARLCSAGVSGENINSTKAKIEEMLDTICSAFDKQLDALYGDTALDISTDIQVLDAMMQQQGLTGENPLSSH